MVFPVNQGQDRVPIDSYWQTPACACLQVTYSVTGVEIHVVSQLKT